ncbi:hypothetical protein LSAT2_005301 [Lamellibrachia satsuma]|nr:hypothetical protein LSAT2_005301 [Lamellibrachia satsuma]
MRKGKVREDYPVMFPPFERSCPAPVECVWTCSTSSTGSSSSRMHIASRECVFSAVLVRVVVKACRDCIVAVSLLATLLKLAAFQSLCLVRR